VRFAIFVYDGIESIDIGATYGVLSMAKRIAPTIEMFVVAPRLGIIACANGLGIVANHDLTSCPAADVLIVCGGPGWKAQAEDDQTLAFLRRSAQTATIIASVCTGGMILAASGLLDGLQATTKREIVGEERSPLRVMQDRYPAIEAVEARLVDEGAIVTGGGVSLAIDTTLHLLARCFDEAVANETARIIEYTSAWRANQDAFKANVKATDQRSTALR